MNRPVEKRDGENKFNLIQYTRTTKVGNVGILSKYEFLKENSNGAWLKIHVRHHYGCPSTISQYIRWFNDSYLLNLQSGREIHWWGEALILLYVVKLRLHRAKIFAFAKVSMLTIKGRFCGCGSRIFVRRVPSGILPTLLSGVVSARKIWATKFWDSGVGADPPTCTWNLHIADSRAWRSIRTPDMNIPIVPHINVHKKNRSMQASALSLGVKRPLAWSPM